MKYKGAFMHAGCRHMRKTSKNSGEPEPAKGLGKDKYQDGQAIYLETHGRDRD